MNSTSQELTPVEHSTTPAELLSQAIQQGMGVDQLEKLVALQERWEAKQAEKAFFVAFTEWQTNAPEIRKTKQVKFTTNSGTTEYHYAPLGDICRQINQPLKKEGLSYRWEIQDDSKEIKVTAVISHVNGHTERTTMTVTPDASGGKNGIQARGSAIEYAKRYTLIGALGLSTTDSDVDAMLPQGKTLDELHADFMELYNTVYQKDPKRYAKFHPDEWKGEKTAKNYVKAIGEMRKFVYEEQQKAK